MTSVGMKERKKEKEKATKTHANRATNVLVPRDARLIDSLVMTPSVPARAGKVPELSALGGLYSQDHFQRQQWMGRRIHQTNSARSRQSCHNPHPLSQ
jgi:hypothetical protein